MFLFLKTNYFYVLFSVKNTYSILGSRNVSIQDQPVRYQSKPGQNPPGFINTGFESFLNATQGHKPCYQQAIYQSQAKEDDPPIYKLQGFRSTHMQLIYKQSFITSYIM